MTSTQLIFVETFRAVKDVRKFGSETFFKKVYHSVTFPSNTFIHQGQRLTGHYESNLLTNEKTGDYGYLFSPEGQESVLVYRIGAYEKHCRSFEYQAMLDAYYASDEVGLMQFEDKWITEKPYTPEVIDAQLDTVFTPSDLANMSITSLRLICRHRESITAGMYLAKRQEIIDAIISQQEKKVQDFLATLPTTETLTELVLPHTEEVGRYYVLLPLEAPYTPQNFPCLANGCYDYENFTLEDELNIHRLDSGVVRASKTPMRGIRFDYVHGHGRCACGSYVALEHEYSYCKCGREYLKSGVLYSNRNANGLTDKEAETIACAQYERASIYLQAAEAEVEKVKQAIEVYFTLYPEDRELFRGQTPRIFDKYERIAAYDLRCAQEDLESIVVDLYEDRLGIQESEKEAMPTTNEQAPLNEGVDNIGDIDYGYADPDGNDYHYDCRPNHVGGNPVTYNQEGNRILTALCAACDEPLVSYEDADELWRSLDTSGGGCDINDPVALYAERHNSTATSIDGFIAGYYGYPSQRNMTPQQYATWTGYDFQRNKAWEDGYAIGVAQAQEVEE